MLKGVAGECEAEGHGMIDSCSVGAPLIRQDAQKEMWGQQGHFLILTIQTALSHRPLNGIWKIQPPKYPDLLGASREYKAYPELQE